MRIRLVPLPALFIGRTVWGAKFTLRIQLGRSRIRLESISDTVSLKLADYGHRIYKLHCKMKFAAQIYLMWRLRLCSACVLLRLLYIRRSAFFHEFHFNACGSIETQKTNHGQSKK